MQPLSRSSAYTAAEVAAALHAVDGSRRMSYRFEVLDSTNRRIGDLEGVLGGKVSNNAFADIKRQLTLDMVDAASLNFLSDRIKPYAVLKMPDRTRYVPQPLTLEWGEARRNLVRSPAGPGATTPQAAGDWRAPADLSVVTDAGQEVIQATENVAGSSIYIDPNTNFTPPVGSTIRYSIGVKTNRAAIADTMRLRFPGYNGAAVDDAGANTPIPVDEWVRLTLVAKVTAMPAGGYVRAIVWPSGASPDLETYIRVRNAIVEVAPPGVELGPDTYFDGDDADSSLTRYRWLGDPGQSESVQEVVVGTSPASAAQWTELRRNYAPNPAGPSAPISASGWRGSTDTREAVVVDGQLAIRTTESNGDGSIYVDPTINPSAKVGDTLRYSIEVRTDDPTVAANMRAYWAAYGGGAIVYQPPAKPIPVGEWVRITIETTVTEAPEGNYFRALVWPYGVPMGASFDVRRAVMEVGQNLGPVTFFDGSSAPLGPLHRRRWVGTPNLSASVEESGVLVPPPPLVIPDTGPGFVEWPLGVFLLESPDRALKASGIVSRTVKGHDQLILLAEDKMPTRRSFAAGTRYTTAIKTLADEAGVTSALQASTLTMPAALEWEPGTTRLRAINDLLAAINYESAWFDEEGRLVVRPYLSPAERAPEYRYGADARSVIATSGLSQSLDVFGVPNQWVLVVSEADRPPLTAIYTNNDPSSPTSTVARGRTITDFRDNEDAADQATLDAKARRLAFEASQVIERASFDTLAMPFHSNADVLELDVPKLGLKGVFSEHSWELPLKAGAKMSHTVRRVVTV